MATLDEKAAREGSGLPQGGGDAPSRSSAEAVAHPTTGLSEKALLRRLDRKLLPPLTLLYLLSFLDRSNSKTPPLPPFFW